MALTYSTMLALNTSAPNFSLADTQGRTWSLVDFKQHKGLLVAFICNHCPYVVHIRERLFQLANQWWQKGLGVVAISANDPENYPEDAPAKMAQLAQSYELAFPYLFDAEQSVAKAYHAVCTPEFYLFNGDHQLVYRGRFDASSPGNAEPVTGVDLSAAVTALFTGESIAVEQQPSMGCNIKWRSS